MINQTNPNANPSGLILDRETFSRPSRTLPGILGVGNAAWVSSSNDEVTAVLVNSATFTSDMTWQDGRPGRQVVLGAVANSGIQLQNNTLLQFNNIGDECVIEEEVRFSGSGQTIITGVFFGLGATDSTVYNNAVGSLGTDKVGIHKTITGTAFNLVVNQTAYAIPGYTVNDSDRHFIRLTITKTNVNATSARIRVQIFKNLKSNGRNDQAVEVTFDVTDMPSATTSLRQSRAWFADGAATSTVEMFGDACRFITKA